MNWLEKFVVPDNLRDGFACDGYVRLGKVLSAAGLDALRERADALMLGQVSHPGLFFQHDSASGRYEDLAHGEGWVGPSLEYRKLEKLEKDPLFLTWIENPFFHQIVQSFIPGEIVLYRAVLFNKSAKGGSPLPWHQDGGRFWGIHPEPFVQLWTALDDCPSNGGCLEIVPKTHRGGLATPLGGVVPKNHLEAQKADENAVSLPAEAGEVILLHNHLWHKAGVNRSGHARRILSVCYMSAQTRCLRKKRAPRVFFPVFRSAV